MSSLNNRFYRFGDFTLDTDQRVLLREGKPVALTPKVFDTLLILVENSGQIVEKEELMRRLWPDSFVEEGNLSVNIQQLRKTLSDDARAPRFIGTVARRGYRFIAEVEAFSSHKIPADNERESRLPETNDALSADSARTLSRIDPAPVFDIDAADENKSTTPERTPELAPARAASSNISRKSAAALAVTIVVALIGGGLGFWKLSDGSNRSRGDDRRTDGKSLPLKLEKLTATGQSRQVAISSDGKHIAYTRQFEKTSSIWLRELATNTNLEIVPAGGRIAGLAFANSGESVYFVRGDPGATALYRVSLFGGVPAKIVDSLEGNFSISGNDSHIALIRQTINHTGQQEYSLIVVDADGKGERTLFVGTYPNKVDAPLWSPDGASIICSFGYSEGGGQDVSIIEVSVADGTKKELSSDRFFRIAKMAWLPHKRAAIICARKNLGDNNQLWRVSYPEVEISRITEELSPFLDLSIASGTGKAVASQATRISDIWIGSGRETKNLKRITQALDTFCWTPNGHIVYSSTASGNVDLWMMQPDGSEQRQLTVSPAVDGNPAVAPDNRYIIFSSNRASTLQIWRMNLDGSNQIQLTSGASKNYPSISADGKWVIFNSTDDWHLWKVSIDGGEPKQLTDYPARSPSVSPDGKMIACAARNELKGELEISILPFEGGPPLKKMQLAGARVSTSIKWTPDGKSLIYLAELGERITILKQPLTGGSPVETASFDEGELSDFGYSSDGQFLGVTRGVWQHDVVLISDLNRY